MTPELADQTLFADNLTCQFSLPCHLHTATETSTAGAEMRLHAVALIEDGRIEDNEERQDKGPAFQRIEAKIDLLLALCGRLIASQGSALIPRMVKMSAQGIALDLAAPLSLPADGSNWAISLQAADWLPDPVTLPVELLATENHGDTLRLYLRFQQSGPGLQGALERHIFRLHRRHVAQQRQTR